MKHLKNSLIFLLFLFLLFLTSCTSNAKKVETILNNDLTNSIALNEEKINNILIATNAPYGSVNYKNLVTEMLKNLKYEIISVEYNKEDKNVLAVVELTTQKNDLLIKDFFNSVVNESIEDILQAKEVNKKELFEISMGKMYNTYKNSITTLGTEKNRIELVFELNENKKWYITNKDTYYNGLVGGLFTKIQEFNTNTLPEMFLTSFLNSLKNITLEQAKNLFSFKDTPKSDFIYNIFSKFYNSLNYEIKSKTLEDDVTKFTLNINTIDATAYYSYILDEYVKYYKTQNDNKKTPTNEELSIKTEQLFLESFDINSTNLKSKELEIEVTSSLNIVNIGAFFNDLIADFIVESNNFSKNRTERIKNLYTTE